MDFRKTFLIKEKVKIKEVYTYTNKCRNEVLYQRTEKLKLLGWMLMPFVYLIHAFTEGFPSATEMLMDVVKNKGKIWSNMDFSSKEKFSKEYGEKMISEFKKNEEN